MSTVVDTGRRAPWTVASRRVLSGAPVSVLISFVVVLVLVVWVLVPSLITSSNPVDAVPLDKLRSPSPAHWFGTDYLGRDVLTRVIYGARSSVLTAGVAVGIGLVVGGGLGMLGGFFGGVVDAVIGRVVDTMLAIPGLLLAVAIVVTLGFHDINAAVATGITSIAIFARIMRAEVLKVRQSVFIESAYLQGGSRTFVLFAHVLPNAYRSVLALAVLQFGSAILVIAALAFLGYGSPPPASSWGLLIADGSKYQVAPWLIYCPAAVVVVTVLSINRISRWLRTPR
ncbi:ABC transporter permease [Patulibacter sp. NPDC049589]|uniref:ABC transporter permease n=1 Tax=Patulibacter sp. NPDC049589 TaxID=3154731 RepID=UPI0034416812